MPTAWLMRPKAVSCLQGAGTAVSTAASGPDPVGKCIPIGRSGLPCLMCTLKGMWWMMASAQSHCTCEPHTACLPTYLRYGHLQHSWCRRIWDAQPVTAVAFSHAPHRLFWEWQVHADHSTSGTVLWGPGLLLSYAAGLQGTGQASPLPCGAAWQG